MSRYAQLMSDAVKYVASNAGIICTSFTPSTGAVSGIIGVTNGGVTIAEPEKYVDYAEGMDNAPKGSMEFKRTSPVGQATMSGTFNTLTIDGIKRAFGAATSETNAETGVTTITPNAALKTTDFLTHLYFVCDYSEDTSSTTGGFIAVEFDNVLFTQGFNMKTADAEKASNDFTATAHPSISTPEQYPYRVYVKGSSASAVETVTLTDTNNTETNNTETNNTETNTTETTEPSNP